MNQEDIISPEVKEVLSRIPPWYENWGISLIALVFSAGVLMTWFIRYPDTISAPVLITTQSPPIVVFARTDGVLTRLQPENAGVEKGKIIAVIANPASAEEVVALEKLLDSLYIPTGLSVTATRLKLPRYLQLGEIQPYFSEFSQSLDHYQYLHGADYFSLKEENMNRRSRTLEELDAGLSRQKRILIDELDVFRRKFSRDSLLAIERVITPADFEKTQIEYLKKEHTLEAVLLAISQNTLHKSELIEALITGREQHALLLHNARVSLQANMHNLKGRIDEWKLRYVISSPVKGTLAYLQHRTESQFVKANEALFSIIPVRNDLVGQVQLPVQGSGRVAPGQRVIIRLDNYPFHQFGSLDGKVTGMSLVPDQNHYLLTLSLTNGLLTSYGKQLEFRQQMQGEAQIVIEEFSLFERILFQLKSIFISQR